MLGSIGLILVTLFATGLIFTLIVKLTVSVGKYIIKKVREHKHQVAAARIKKLIDEMKHENTNQAKQSDANNMLNKLGHEAVAIWEEDENDEVIEDSIEIVEGTQVDNKTRTILNDNNGWVVIPPTAV